MQGILSEREAPAQLPPHKAFILDSGCHRNDELVKKPLRREIKGELKKEGTQFEEYRVLCSFILQRSGLSRDVRQTGKGSARPQNRPDFS